MSKYLVGEAMMFAIAAHSAIGQVRKYTGEPYYHHCINVADKVRAIPEATPEMVAAAYLHDTVEDTQVPLKLIAVLFSKKVAHYVDLLSDLQTVEDGNRATRKAAYIEKLRGAPPEVQTIKLADLIDNTQSIVEHDKDFARIYIPEKIQLLEVLTEGDEYLYSYAEHLCRQAIRELGI